ncbi:CYTH domain-containing protein [Natronospira bacteriovora]|uniref:CYTH domain-containing protein n=1 Tax=Natronospira bacteriovora TaxID=3069753 RepID=A0ABU0W2N2_9GAMM|nr:CYTH domain-containing protein [Natronospira sp. AB-CW4]MDQ2068276.1 CYTH domain-containing protein [Natronospira sp. AB-CW4]
MAREIERKFLVRNDDWRAVVQDRQHFRQGYLTDHRHGKASVRLRLRGEQAELNIKSLELGVSRQEYEYPIPATEAREMLDHLCPGPQVEKFRHWVHDSGHIWEVDEFLGDNSGLVVAEVELEREDQTVNRPHWLGPEVTHLERYYNVALITHPYRQWTVAEREAVDAG